MGFKPQGMPTPFTPRQQSAGQQRKRIIDILVTIDGYDLAQRQINCTSEDGRKLMVQIRPETIARNVARAQERADQRPQAPKWEGYLIDQRMAEHLPVGHKVVIEKAEVVRSFQHNGVLTRLINGDRVLNVADPSPKKTFEGLFSVSTYQSHIFHVQSWERKAILIDDQAEIQRIRDALTDDAQAFLRKELRPHHGVQFRAVVPDESNSEQFIVIDTSPYFDWISRKLDANGVEVAPGHPMDGDKFMELLFGEQDSYTAYIRDKFPASSYPGLFIEVCPYINYRAGPSSRYMAIPEKSFDPLYKLAYTQTKLAMDDVEFIQGKNLAVLGVLQLSSDQADAATHSFKPRNIAVRLHASGPMGHVHAWVHTHHDKKTSPHPALRQVQVARATPGEKTSSMDTPPAPPVKSQAAPASAPAAQPAFTDDTGMGNRSAFDDWEELDDAFPFDSPPPASDSDAARKRLEEARASLKDD